MTVSPLCLEHDLGLAMLPPHCLWSHIVYGLCVCLCVFERPLMCSQRARGLEDYSQEGREMTVVTIFGK